MSEDDRVERFSRGDRFAVDPVGIERELALLWKEVAGDGTDGGNKGSAVTRACLWNLIAHSEAQRGAEGEPGAGQLEAVLRELPQHVATRTIVLNTQAAAADRPELESWISANCFASGDSGKEICSEEVTIAARGRGEVHLPALVRALLVPDVPTAAVFAGVPPRERPMVEELVETADRIVGQADASADRAPLARYLDVADRAPLGLIDLGWLRSAPLRGLVAELFDGPADGEAWRGLTEVVVRHPPTARAGGALMAGWIAWRLGAGGRVAPKLTKAAPNRWKVAFADGRGFELATESVADAPPGRVARVALRAGAKLYAVEVMGDNTAELTVPGQAARRARIEAHGEPALLARALGTRSQDASFLGALKIAGRLP